MTHRFNVKHVLTGVTLPEVRQLMAVPAFHEDVARKVPGFNLQIQHSSLAASTYQMKREVNMDVNIPDLAKKFLKDAFKLWRSEEWNLETLTCHSHFKLNMPAEFRCKVALAEESGRIVANHDWEVEVHVPLVHGILARHAEGEIRRFNQIEIDIIQQEIGLKVAGLRGL